MIKKYKEQGFTLVELLVVISIIAILSIVSVAGYTQFISKAKVSNCTNEMTQLRDMLKTADEDDNNYFILDGVIYTDTQITKDTSGNITNKLATGTTSDSSSTKTLYGLIAKYFPDMLTPKDNETRTFSISDGSSVIYVWSKNGETITTTWNVSDGTITSTVA